jgi:hypothetical protein
LPLLIAALGIVVATHDIFMAIPLSHFARTTLITLTNSNKKGATIEQIAGRKKPHKPPEG